MSYTPAGPWRNFTFKEIEAEDMPRVLDHLRKFFLKHERTCELVGAPETLADDFLQMFQWGFDRNDGLCFMALDNESGKIAGVRMTYVKTKVQTTLSGFEFKCEAAKKVLRVFRQLEQQCNTFEHYGLDRYAFFLAASTDSEFRNQGLATEMYKRSFALLRDRKIPLVECIFSSPYSRKCADNFGFEEVGVVKFKGLKDEDGSIMFPDAQDGDMACLRCLKL